MRAFFSGCSGIAPGTRTIAKAASVLIVCLACAACPGGEETSAADAARLAELADGFRKHCVGVFFYGKSHDGEAPESGGFAADIANERPTPLGGYWWDERHVVVEDPVLQDQFIDSVEVATPFSSVHYPARVAGRFVRLPALLVEVLPDDDGLLPRPFPLDFADSGEDEPLALSYAWDDGEWRVAAGSLIGGVSVADSGRASIDFGADGVIVSKDGAALGLAFGEQAPAGEDMDFWKGPGVRSAPILSASGAEEFNSRLGRELSGLVLQTRFHLRVKIDDDADRLWVEDGGPDSDVSEVRATGLAVGGRHLLVPLSLGAEAISRIEDITVTLEDGSRIDAAFVGAFRDYKAVLVEAELDLAPGGTPFSLLNPLIAPPEDSGAGNGAAPSIHEYFHRWRIDHSLGRRKESVDYDRWLGVFRGYRNDVVTRTRTNEGDGALAFDVNGRLIALSLTPRVMRGGEVGTSPGPGFRPVAFLGERFRAPDVFDPALAPVDEDRGRRLIDLGVEYQGLDGNASRLFHAARETRGGEIGMLVTHVYPGFAAAALGIREHDVLLRLFAGGGREPVELKADRYGAPGEFDPGGMSAENIQQMMSFMPPPWPSRENGLSRVLAGVGVGRNVVLEYLREGEILRSEFVTEYAAPDFRNAPKEIFDRLGLTVKPITYEVARYFGRPENSGVIVSRVEDGSRGSVAGLHPYLFIARVDGGEIASMDAFRRAVGAFEEGTASTVELMVEAFGKTRLVKIEQGN